MSSGWAERANSSTNWKRCFPADFDTRENVTYIEPFVGGGAMLFYMLQTHPNIKSAVINDINTDLITCYRVVRNNPDALVSSLSKIQAEY